MPSLLSAALLAGAATSALATGHASFPIRRSTVSGGLHKRTATFDGVLLRNHSYTSYIIDLEIGTPPQLVSVSIDTGSSALWVNPDCETSGNAAFCNQQDQFSPGDSSTWESLDDTSFLTYGSGNASLDLGTDVTSGNAAFCNQQDQFSPGDSSTWESLDDTSFLTYGSGNASLDLGTDVVSLPALVGGTTMTIPSFQFGVAEETYNMTVGILGVGFGLVGGLTDVPNIIDALAMQNLTNGRVFSIALGNLSATDAAGNGVIIFGGIDTKKFAGPLVPLPNLPEQPIEIDPHPMPRYWVTLDSITINGTELVTPTNSSNNLATANTPISTPQLLANSSGPVLMDSGTTFLQMPSQFMAAIAAAMGGSLYDGSVVIDCAWMHSVGWLQFVFGEAGGNQVAVDVPLAAAVFFDPDAGLCGLGIQPGDGDIMIMGDVLMRQAYVLFDQDNQNIYIAPFADCGTAGETLPQLSEGEVFDYTGQCETSAFVEEMASIAAAAAAAADAAAAAAAAATAATATGTDSTSTAATPTKTGNNAAAASGTAQSSLAGRSFALSPMSTLLLAAGVAAQLLI